MTNSPFKQAVSEVMTAALRGGVSVTQLAQALGVSRHTIYLWQNNVEPHAPEMMMFALRRVTAEIYQLCESGELPHDPKAHVAKLLKRAIDSEAPQ